jgi:diguanylate cyclase (GGDEF)-like protein
MSERIKAEARANRLARTDALTDLPNRLHFVERLKTLTGRSAAEFEPFSLVQVDIDRFRSVNTVHGPEVGDAVLREVASRINATVRDFDLIARTAADEFSLIVPAANGSGTDIAQALRNALNGAFKVQGRSAPRSG